MTTQYQPLNETAAGVDTNLDAAYAWYLLNRDEINEISDNDDLQTLREIESELNLAPGTADRFKAIRDDASSVSETEESRYAAAWDAYHEALDADKDMAALARLYGQRVHMPIYQRIDATGTFTF
jgi:hypothetical protein